LPGQGRSPLWRNRDFILLWSGQVVSTIGTRVTSVAYPLLVLAQTHSPAKAGLVGFAQSLPYMLFYLPAGALVDRWNRKRVMLVADAGRALALGSLALALALDELTLAQIIVVAFVEGSLFVFFSLSESAALPQIVPKEQLPTAVAQNQARIQGADLAGQPLGGALFGISRLLPFAADAISYAISFVSLLFVRPAFQEERERAPTVEAEDRVPVLRPAAIERFDVAEEPGGYRVAGRRVERAVAMTDLENPEAVAFLRRIIDRMGVTGALESAGVKPGDAVRFGKHELEWE